MKPCIFLLIALQLLFVTVPAWAKEIKTLISDDDTTNILTLGEGESAELVYAHNMGQGGTSTAKGVFFNITKGTKTYNIPGYVETGGWHAPIAPVTIAGPATIRSVHPGGPPIIATFSVTRVGTASNPAAIPIETGSTFQIILESSSDLVNWTPANPGDYSGTEAKRFFRTRIIKK